jgi:hypothetical protein
MRELEAVVRSQEKALAGYREMAARIEKERAGKR